MEERSIRVADSPLTGTFFWATVATMFALVEAIMGGFFSAFRSKASLVVENLLLRQQLAILRRIRPRPRLRSIDSDSIYGTAFDVRVQHLGVEQLTIAPRPP